jgi:serine phosphatase RsbU (regulator of sigma subunit)
VESTEARADVPPRSFAIEVGAAKTNKYASRDSGDTVEVVERPGGGLSVVMVDGQGSGQAAKSLSLQLTSRAVAMLKDGVRDGAVARAVHDGLFAFRHGKVSATLETVSVDLRERSIVVSRNAATPYSLRRGGQWESRGGESAPIGLYRFTKPAIEMFPIELGLGVVIATDGIRSAGRRRGREPVDVLQTCHGLGANASAQELADAVLKAALELDDGRPGDDMTVAAVVIALPSTEPLIRRLRFHVPIG